MISTVRRSRLAFWIVTSVLLGLVYVFATWNPKLDSLSEHLISFVPDALMPEPAHEESLGIGQAVLSCLHERSLVVLANGTRVPISTVKVGDLLRTRDPISGMSLPVAVVAIRTAVRAEWIPIADGLVVTPEHPIWADSKWSRADNLMSGQSLYAEAHILPYSRSDTITSSGVAFDISVAYPNTFEAGQDGVLVHNKIY